MNSLTMISFLQNNPNYWSKRFNGILWLKFCYRFVNSYKESL